jgi:predicted deacetylase
MIPRPAQYLLRFDDLCPTVSFERWRRCASLVEEFHIRPILAVVPDNRDPDLQLSPPDHAFWERVRAMEAAGAAIALHGYRHLCLSRGRGLLPLHRRSEFAGVPAETQRAWIGEGLSILRGHGLNPLLWVAPRHGFDRSTLSALRAEGIRLLSDGFARVPFVRDGLAWLPQQLWAPAEKTKGLWTLCVHANSADRSQIEKLRVFLSRHAAQITSVDRVLAEFPPAPLTLAESAYVKLALWRVQASNARKRLRSRLRKAGSS